MTISLKITINYHEASKVRAIAVAVELICTSTAYQGGKAIQIQIMNERCCLELFVASTITLQYNSGPVLPQISKHSPAPHHMQECKCATLYPFTAYYLAKTLFYTYDMDLGCSLQMFGASTMTLQYLLGLALH
jgi:hypothetical protein